MGEGQIYSDMLDPALFGTLYGDLEWLDINLHATKDEVRIITSIAPVPIICPNRVRMASAISGYTWLWHLYKTGSADRYYSLFSTSQDAEAFVNTEWDVWEQVKYELVTLLSV